MAFGSITTVTGVWEGPVASGDSFYPVAGVVLASASSVAHVTVDVNYTSGNTGEAAIRLYSSLGSGAFSADTEWSDREDMVYSIVSTTDPNQSAFVVNGVYAWRVGVRNSSASSLNINLGYRID